MITAAFHHNPALAFAAALLGILGLCMAANWLLDRIVPELEPRDDRGLSDDEIAELRIIREGEDKQ
jgi:flagellar biogenesis protein FliO